ncbi:Mcd4p [Sugiyamaella lignohabitans]|uniref:GPI ethanolamine phosphate transferase 1 n=1 Tax=Sugiyamaella lignohabitans TaxID=796027 RepID=A0A161HLJ8_9ASCO|nr:Mcd4p [Sugiyamaella lignohabitans]ANB14247.1 Mcd4p [Sugiyamaella lignohabitans]
MSIFDIYFVSPLVHGMRHFSTPENPPAKRLFLIVGDGLRADSCFLNITHPVTNEAAYLTPFIRDKVLNHGTFGVSHTRMPTESRPGHVAIIAGFYEDVSAVTKGWKENPVDFDSVFNQSRHTYSYGSPDILPMFADGASDPDRVDAIMYGHESEDFTKSSIELDKFVFDHLDRLFDEAKVNADLNEYLRQDKIVFFLHLLGIDTAGHSYRPYSPEYYDNIKYIDTKIAELETKVNQFYGDGKTTWVFTADHGMSDFGSHGDGHPNNTRTPLVAWGAGVPKPITTDLSGHDEFSNPWNLPVKRNDVNQADIAPLMSYLVGLNYPANSVGELPLAFVDASDKTKSEALKANAYAIIEQYLVKESEKRKSQLNFTPFGPLSGETSIEARKAEIEALIANNQFEQSIIKAEELMVLGLKGLRYLQTYNWLFLRSLVTTGFLGWIGYATTSFFHLFVIDSNPSLSHRSVIRVITVGVLAILCGLLYHQESPIHFYLYAIFPAFFWDQIFENAAILTGGIKSLVSSSPTKNKTQTSVFSLVFLVGLFEAIVYGYFYREIFSLCFGIAAMWPWIQDFKIALKNIWLSAFWALLCIILAIFTILPVLKVESIEQIVAAGVLMTLIGLYYTVHLGNRLRLSITSLVLCGVQLGLIILSVIVTRSSVKSLQARQGLPVGNQIVGWLVLVGSLIVPFLNYFSPVSDYRYRLLTLFMAFSPTFVLLTISYEGLFYVSFFAILVVWLEFESQFYVIHPQRKLSLSEFRTALFFFFLSQVGFFGTGNVASISSFSLDSVYRLIPIFDPFAMSALLMFKIMVPFAILSVTLGLINLRLGVPKSALFSMVLSVSDILSLNFFYLVVDEGSWLDIGTGISHYCISSLLCLFMILLEYLSGVLVSGIQIKSVESIKATKTKSK